jgi:hypothetical protein
VRTPSSPPNIPKYLWNVWFYGDNPTIRSTIHCTRSRPPSLPLPIVSISRVRPSGFFLAQPTLSQQVPAVLSLWVLTVSSRAMAAGEFPQLISVRLTQGASCPSLPRRSRYADSQPLETSRIGAPHLECLASGQLFRISAHARKRSPRFALGIGRPRPRIMPRHSRTQFPIACHNESIAKRSAVLS